MLNRIVDGIDRLTKLAITWDNRNKQKIAFGGNNECLVK
jgi:hypothetical protein